MEYFAAYELTRLTDGPEALAKLLLPRVARAEWEIVAELAVQISNKHSKEGAARVFETFLSDRRKRSSRSRNNIHAFMLRCMSFLHVPLPLARRVSEAAVETSVSALAGETGSTDCFSEMAAVLPELADTVRGGIEAKLTEILTGPQGPRQQAAIEVTLELDKIPFFLRARSARRTHLTQGDFYTALSRDLTERHRDTILIEGDYLAVWLGALNKGIVDMETFLRGCPAAGLLLDPLTADAMYKYLGVGWVGWGPHNALRVLADTFDQEHNDPVRTVLTTNFERLATRLDEQPPPWCSHHASNDRLWGFGADRFRCGSLGSEAGWGAPATLLPVLEAFPSGTERNEANPKSDVRDFLLALIHARRRRGSMPSWVTEELSYLPPHRRDTIADWCAGELITLAGSAEK